MIHVIMPLLIALGIAAVVVGVLAVGIKVAQPPHKMGD